MTDENQTFKGMNTILNEFVDFVLQYREDNGGSNPTIDVNLTSSIFKYLEKEVPVDENKIVAKFMNGEHPEDICRSMTRVSVAKANSTLRKKLHDLEQQNAILRDPDLKHQELKSICITMFKNGKSMKQIEEELDLDEEEIIDFLVTTELVENSYQSVIPTVLELTLEGNSVSVIAEQVALEKVEVALIQAWLYEEKIKLARQTYKHFYNELRDSSKAIEASADYISFTPDFIRMVAGDL